MRFDGELRQELGRSSIAPWIRADAKTQVTVGANDAVDRVVIAVQHAAEGERESGAIQRRIKAVLTEHDIRPLFGELPSDRITVNGTGSFVIGGPIGDAGVVSRKIVVDAYGPHIAVGGGAYSGKDPTKVDRSAAYMARYIANTATQMRIRGARAVTVLLHWRSSTGHGDGGYRRRRRYFRLGSSAVSRPFSSRHYRDTRPLADDSRWGNGPQPSKLRG
jgi:S-adenosylmethionine synthetase